MSAGPNEPVTVPLPPEMHLRVLRAAERLGRHKTQIIRACISLCLHRLEDPATLIDLLESGELGNQNREGRRSEGGLENV